MINNLKGLLKEKKCIEECVVINAILELEKWVIYGMDVSMIELHKHHAKKRRIRTTV